MDFYFTQSLILLVFVIPICTNTITIISWGTGLTSTKECVTKVVSRSIIAVLIIVSILGIHKLGSVPTSKTAYTEVISARYVQSNNHSLFYSTQHEYIEATFKVDGKTIRHKFPLNDIEILGEEEKSMVGTNTLLRPYILTMTEEDYNNVLNIHTLEG